MRNNDGYTVLHCACYGDTPVANIRQLFHIWPVASLFLASVFSSRDHEHRPMLPCGGPVDRRRTQEVIDFIAEATKDTFCALIEYALCAYTSMSVAERDRLRNFITALNIPGLDTSASGVALSETVLPHLTTDLIHNLVNNDDLQEQLKDKDLQSLLCGLVRMNKAGRNYIQGDPSNTIKGLVVLNSIAHNVDCMFVHMRENVSLMHN
jgi:hypothetical protein